MRPLLLATLLTCAGCASSFQRVKNAQTLEEAKAMLGSERPTVKIYGPNAEAWYFRGDDCVLFVDGTVRTTKAAADRTPYTRKDRGAQPQLDACAP